MGCDIHMFIEHKTENKIWSCFGGEINPGRNYRMFAVLAGVRNYDNEEPVSKPKGVPDNISWKTEESYTMFISENPTDEPGWCTPERAKRWVENGTSKYYGRYRVTHPDWHNHSWLTKEEYKEALSRVNDCYVDYRAVLAVMETFEELGEQTRLVFWFDN